MNKAEVKIKFLMLIDISSTGKCSKTDQELAFEANTTVPFVQSVLKSMQSGKEILISTGESGREIVYPKAKKTTLW
jgi:hypothetical protein